MYSFGFHLHFSLIFIFILIQVFILLVLLQVQQKHPIISRVRDAPTERAALTNDDPPCFALPPSEVHMLHRTLLALDVHDHRPRRPCL